MNNLGKLFAELPLPVLVCRKSEGLPLEYLNAQALMLFAPTHTLERILRDVQHGNLLDVMRFSDVESAQAFTRTLTTSGQAANFTTTLLTFDEVALPVRIFGNSVNHDGHDYYIIYLVRRRQEDEKSFSSRLPEMISATLLEDNVDDAIDTLLALAGRQMDVSRVYIFEETSPTTTRNTYEWCAPGVEPAIQDLQDLPKEDYPYDSIIEGGMFVVNDIRSFDDPSREILEMQGIKSLAIIPIYDVHQALGYVGYDDTKTTRGWSHEEIQYLKSVAMLLASLMKRRNSENSLRRSQNILQLITDNSEDIMYANRLDDYSLVFVSESLAKALGTTVDQLLGRPCYEVLQKGQTAPCPFCPIPHIRIDPGADRGEVYEWENNSNAMNRTYLAKDNIVRWVDGSYVHMEVAADITSRIEYEKNLRRVASTDSMTGIYNREWGTRRLEEKLYKCTSCSLCFVDLDGLKKVNDSLGHAAGDELITETIRILREHISGEDFICRWGGDEFIIWMDRPMAEAQALMEDATRAVDAYNATSGKPFKLSFSYGVVQHAKGDDLDALVTEADQLMYKNKMEKRGLAKRRRRGDGVE